MIIYAVTVFIALTAATSAQARKDTEAGKTPEQTEDSQPERKRDARWVFGGTGVGVRISSFADGKEVSAFAGPDPSQIATYTGHLQLTPFVGVHLSADVLVADRSWTDHWTLLHHFTLPFNFFDYSSGYVGLSAGYRHTKTWRRYYGIDASSSAPAFGVYAGIRRYVSTEIRYTQYESGDDPSEKFDDLVIRLRREAYAQGQLRLSVNEGGQISPYLLGGRYFFKGARLATPMEELSVSNENLNYAGVGVVARLSPYLRATFSIQKIIAGDADRESLFLMTGLRALPDSYDTAGVAIEFGL